MATNSLKECDQGCHVLLTQPSRVLPKSPRTKTQITHHRRNNSGQSENCGRHANLENYNRFAVLGGLGYTSYSNGVVEIEFEPLVDGKPAVLDPTQSLRKKNWLSGRRCGSGAADSKNFAPKQMTRKRLKMLELVINGGPTLFYLDY